MLRTGVLTVLVAMASRGLSQGEPSLRVSGQAENRKYESWEATQAYYSDLFQISKNTSEQHIA